MNAHHEGSSNVYSSREPDVTSDFSTSNEGPKSEVAAPTFTPPKRNRRWLKRAHRFGAAFACELVGHRWIHKRRNRWTRDEDSDLDLHCFICARCRAVVHMKVTA